MTTLIPKYSQGATGSVNRPINKKLGESVSVLDFGADATGVADSAAAFNAAIMAVGYGGSVFVPTGTYTLNSKVTIPVFSNAQSGITIYGEHTGSIIRGGATVTSLFEVTGANTTIFGLDFANTGSYATNAILVTISSSNASLSAQIYQNSIVGFTYGIKASGQNYNIYDNYFQNNTYHIYFSNDGRNSAINNNYMLGGNNGVIFVKDTTQVEGTRIINNTILVTGGNGAGISLSDGLEIYIAFNIIDQTGANSPAINMNAAASSGTINRIKIISNWIDAGASSYGIFASGNSSYIDVIDNTFADNGNTGIKGISYNTVNISKIAFNNFLFTGAGNSETSITSSSQIESFCNSSKTGNPMNSYLNGVVNFSSATGIATYTTTDKNAIPTPVAGLVVFDTTLLKLCVYNGTTWQTVTST